MSRCPCMGTGRCTVCRATGRSGTGKCHVCFGTGKCSRCSGRGRIGDFEFHVEGTDAKEVERVAKALMDKGMRKMAESSKVSIHLHNSTVGILNAGEIEDVQSISVNVSSIAASGHDQMAKALKELTEAVAASQQISSDERAYLLDNLEELSKQAALMPEERAKSGVIKSLLSGVASSIGSAGGLAEIWSTWGTTIRAFFGF